MVNTQRLSSTEERAKRGASRIHKELFKTKRQCTNDHNTNFSSCYVPKEAFSAMIGDLYQGLDVQFRLVEPLCQMMGYTFVSRKNTTLKAPRVLDIKACDWCHGLRGASENPEKKLGGPIFVHVVERLPPVLRFGRVCNELRSSSSWPTAGTSQIFRGRPRVCDCGMENCIIMVEKVPNKGPNHPESDSTATGDFEQEEEEEARFLVLLKPVS